MWYETVWKYLYYNDTTSRTRNPTNSIVSNKNAQTGNRKVRLQNNEFQRKIVERGTQDKFRNKNEIEPRTKGQKKSDQIENPHQKN